MSVQADRVFGSSIDRALRNPFKKTDREDEFIYVRNLVKGKFIYLQNDVTSLDKSTTMNMMVANIDYILCSAVREQEAFCDKQYQYLPENLLLTGMPRFDLLRPALEPKKQIMILPTYRPELVGLMYIDWGEYVF